MKLNFISLILILMLSPVLSQLAHAQGSKGGGGGDLSELTVDEIRENILKWIESGRASGLEFRNGTTLQEYEQKMKKLLAPQAVIFTFTNDAANVKVEGRDKTCRSGFAKASPQSKNETPFITCLRHEFSNPTLIPEDKNSRDNAFYRIIHHEFAALALMERNEGAASDYYLSNQISAQGRYEKVFRLPVGPLNHLGTQPLDTQDPNELWPQNREEALAYWNQATGLTDRDWEQATRPSLLQTYACVMVLTESLKDPNIYQMLRPGKFQVSTQAFPVLGTQMTSITQDASLIELFTMGTPHTLQTFFRIQGMSSWARDGKLFQQSPAHHSAFTIQVKTVNFPGKITERFLIIQVETQGRRTLEFCKPNQQRY